MMVDTFLIIYSISSVHERKESLNESIRESSIVQPQVIPPASGAKVFIPDAFVAEPAENKPILEDNEATDGSTPTDNSAAVDNGHSATVLKQTVEPASDAVIGEGSEIEIESESKTEYVNTNGSTIAET